MCTPASWSTNGRMHPRKKPAQALDAGWGHLGRGLECPRCRKSGLEHWALNGHILLAPWTLCLVGRPQTKETSMKAKVRASPATSQGSTIDQSALWPSDCFFQSNFTKFKWVGIYFTVYKASSHTILFINPQNVIQSIYHLVDENTEPKWLPAVTQ